MYFLVAPRGITRRRWVKIIELSNVLSFRRLYISRKLYICRMGASSRNPKWASTMAHTSIIASVHGILIPGHRWQVMHTRPFPNTMKVMVCRNQYHGPTAEVRQSVLILINDDSVCPARQQSIACHLSVNIYYSLDITPSQCARLCCEPLNQ